MGARGGLVAQALRPARQGLERVAARAVQRSGCLRQRGSEPSLLTAEPPATPLRLRRSGAAVKRRRPTIGKPGRSRGSRHGFAHSERAPVELGAVELFDSEGNRRRIAELHERKSSRPLRRAIGWQEYFCHLADLGEQGLEVPL